MAELPDIRRPPLTAPVARLAERLVRHAPELVWRSLHPLEREVFSEGARRPPVRRLDYRSEDGWRGSIQVESERPGTSAAPVLLLHTLGLGAEAFRYGRGTRWVDPWLSAGYRAYLPSWRGDRGTVGPVGVGACFDDLVRSDLPAILEAVLRDSGAQRVLMVGHGIGGQAALGYVARWGDTALSGLAVLSSPVRFLSPSTAWASGVALAGRLGGAVRCPSGALARAAAALTSPREASSTDVPRGPRLRGCLLHA